MADQDRLQKLEQIKNQGINPYPYSWQQSHHAEEIHSKYAELEGQQVSVAGRIMSIREHGKLCFLDIYDASGKIQIWISAEDVGKKQFNFLKLIERGDWLGVKGIVTKTKRGEVSVRAKEFQLLSKAIRHLPATWYGLKDVELRYRQRYLDLIMNPEVRNIFITRTKIVNAIREYLNKHNFLEVETPIVQPIYGGAAAKPFVTYVNDLKANAYLRISNELYLKRLIVGGFERVYEFSKDFRNESIDSTHNPEFTQLEFYVAYWDYLDVAKFFEDLMSFVAKRVKGTTKINYQGHILDFGKPWQRLTMYEALEKFGGIEIKKCDHAELQKLAKKYALELPKGAPDGLIINELFEELCEDKLIQPTLLMNHPIETTPLCKPHREHPHLVERFEPYVAGMEIGNAYSELNDPILQRKLFEEQVRMRKLGDEEAHPMDEDFLTALEYGMPPTGGMGIGIDRLAMLFSDMPSIKEVLLFPMMKPREQEK
ncbi:MAG: lysine--tRNA ligase [Candidatus Nanoarchaeia archaeon]